MEYGIQELSEAVEGMTIAASNYLPAHASTPILPPGSTEPATSLPTQFFTTHFPTFIPNHSANIQANFRELITHNNWSLKKRNKLYASPASGEAHTVDEWRYICYESVFEETYGLEAGKLQNWRGLCEEVGVPAGASITQCKAALKSVYVNIFDLLNHRWRGLPGKVRRFASYKEFRAYTKNGRMYPREKAKEEGFLKALLRVIYRA
ncbi:MAG: hypothetical protein M1824_001269 [Vezdaea acicularis]|nr:MAG: hypothetical protein M1824_001269 [Vezdaea acicularis]